VLRRKPAFRLSTAVAPRDTRYGDYDRRLLGTLPSMEHVMAWEEVKCLLRQLKVPIDERGRRRSQPGRMVQQPARGLRHLRRPGKRISDRRSAWAALLA
jgi:hypothetical protein